MAILFKDRVKDTSTTTGTGNFTLAGSPPSGYISFNSAFGTGSTNQFYYCIDGGAEWEVGIGHLSASTTLVRDTFLASSSGSTVSFSAGSKTVFATAAAEEFLTGGLNVLGKATLDLSIGTKQDICTVPSGRQMIPLWFVFYAPTDDLTGLADGIDWGVDAGGGNRGNLDVFPYLLGTSSIVSVYAGNNPAGTVLAGTIINAGETVGVSSLDTSGTETVEVALLGFLV